MLNYQILLMLHESPITTQTTVRCDFTCHLGQAKHCNKCGLILHVLQTIVFVVILEVIPSTEAKTSNFILDTDALPKNPLWEFRKCTFPL